MVIWEFYIYGRNAEGLLDNVYAGRGSLDFGKVLFASLKDLYDARNQQVDVDVHLWDCLHSYEQAAVELRGTCTAFKAQGMGPMGGHKSLCLCCGGWRDE